VAIVGVGEAGISRMIDRTTNPNDVIRSISMREAKPEPIVPTAPPVSTETLEVVVREARRMHERAFCAEVDCQG